MTSGQGENQPGGPYGPPQGWNAPPSPEGYGQQYPGYAPAPSAPTGYGAPQAMERPTTVRAGIGAFVASLLVSLISSIVTLTDLDSVIDRALAASTDPAITEDLIRSSLVIGLVIALAITALEVISLWFAWKGFNWGRIVLWVLGGIGLVFGLIGLAAGGAQSGQTGFTTSMGYFSLLLTAAGVVLLAMKPSNEWFRFRSWQRATGQG